MSTENNSLRFIGKSYVITDPDVIGENLDDYEMQAFEFCKNHNIIMLAQRTNKRGDGKLFGKFYYAISIIRVIDAEILSAGLWFSCGKNPPSCYDVLACVQKYPVGKFWDFIAEYGYEITSNSKYKETRKIWKECKREYAEICKLFPEDHVMQELREIS